MDVLINHIVLIILQYMCESNNHAVYFKLTQCYVKAVTEELERKVALCTFKRWANGLRM